MIRGVTLPLPVSLARLLAVFGPLVTAPSFRTFCSLACGFLAPDVGRILAWEGAAKR